MKKKKYADVEEIANLVCLFNTLNGMLLVWAGFACFTMSHIQPMPH